MSGPLRCVDRMEDGADNGCCVPSRVRHGGEKAVGEDFHRSAADTMDSPPELDLKVIPGRTAILGTDRPVIAADEEGPLRKKKAGQTYSDDGDSRHKCNVRIICE